MTWLGVPILDWVILAGLLVLGVEAWITTRPSAADRQAAEKRSAAPDGGSDPAPKVPPGA
jgi:hypothetical protein